MLFSFLGWSGTRWNAIHPIAIFMAHTRNTRNSIRSYRVGYALDRVPLRSTKRMLFSRVVQFRRIFAVDDHPFAGFELALKGLARRCRDQAFESC